MKQVFLSGAGQIEVFDVPLPARLGNSALIRNGCSLISTGTEGAAVTRHSGYRGLYEKVRGSSERAEQVWDLVHRFGYQKTWEMVRKKLGDYTMSGYSCAGQVVEADHEGMPYAPGQRVACMGVGFASHAEYVTVPANLMAPIPDGVSFDEACFAAMACVAMQGIRRLELTGGERVCVIGLGLVGQLCMRLLVAMGYRAFGIDMNAQRAVKAMEAPGAEAWGLNEVDSVGRVMGLTDGRGVDGVIVCAATASDEPVNQAFDLCRQRGRVSIVGDVGLKLSRSKMYAKEIELRLSCSYGPGRYDDKYEIAGQDYPFGHVRWTEGRNLEHFLELLALGRLDIRSLISEHFPVERAPEAYAHIKQADPNTYGVVFDYGPVEDESPAAIAAGRTLRLDSSAQVSSDSRIQVGLIGAGAQARGTHVPNLKALGETFAIRTVADRSGAAAGVAAKSIGAPVATSDHHELLGDPQIDAVIISTRHASHAQLAMDALNAGKHVLVEKPLATTVEDAQMIEAKAQETGLIVRVGFNRRFSPYMTAMREVVRSEGLRMFCARVNVGPIADHWSNTPEEGGRLLGEGCHFFDLCNWFIGAEPVTVSAVFAGRAEATNPNAMVIVSYPDGSTGQVTYTALGHVRMSKEYFEAFGNGRSVRSDDFRRLEAFGASAGIKGREKGNKGLLAELEEFGAAIRGEEYPIEGADARAGVLATWMAVAARESAKTGVAVKWQPGEALRRAGGREA